MRRYRRDKRMAVAVGAALAMTCVGHAALADTIRDPLGLVGIGTFGDDSGPDGDQAAVGISHAGCAKGTVAVGVNNSGRPCAPQHASIGLAGADARGWEVAVSDLGQAQGCTDGCWPVAVAVAGTGDATSGNNIYGPAVSGTGNADSHNVGISGTGNATGSMALSGGGSATSTWGAVALLGDAQTDYAIAASGIGTASAPGCTGDLTWDATRGYAVSLFGNAYGCHPYSVTGETTETR